MNQRRWLPWLVAAWGVLLFAAGLYAVAHGKATVREQRTIAQARPVVDQAVTAIITAAGPKVAVKVGEYELRARCQINAARPGLNYQRIVELYPPPGGEKDTLRALSAGLPATYRPKLSPEGAELFADAGEFVRIVGTVVEPGQVRVSVYTGCRPAGDEPASPRQ